MHVNYSQVDLAKFLWVMFCLLFFVAMLVFHSNSDPRKGIRDLILKKSFKGRIAKKYLDHKDRGDIKIVLTSGEIVDPFSISLYENALIGDSIVKEAGKIYFTIYRDSLIFKYYPNIRNDEIRG